MHLIITILFLFASDSYAAGTGLPIPRFVSLKSNEINVRTGPGLRYKIKWVMKRKGMPVEIFAEFEQWRKIRDVQGDEGWIHRGMLYGKRTVIITGKLVNGGAHILRKKPDQTSFPIARVEPSVIGEILFCEKDFCRIRAGDYKGWLKKNVLWGVYPNEIID